MKEQGSLITVYLGIGSNIDASNNIASCKDSLQSTFSHCRFSRTFESESVGFKGDNFLNLVAEVTTEQSLPELISSLKSLEDRLGRKREGAKFSSRHIDIDILLFGDESLDTPIKLPREEIYENAYVLWPLAELAPELQDPVSGQLFSSLWSAFDKSTQTLQPID